jgi:catechol 2,3-dioxygenase-like lactoylglutathione lyase family enzyme
MLNPSSAVATVGVKDLNKAKAFYEGTLGFKPQPGAEKGVAAYGNGTPKLFVYESPFAGTNQATAVTWTVDDVDGEARTLKEKGVAFEHYNMPNTTLAGDVHVSGKMRAAWFKDPDGNILAIVNRS